MSPLSKSNKRSNTETNQIKNYIFRKAKRSTPGVFVSCRKCKFSFNKQEQELINFSYQTVTE